MNAAQASAFMASMVWAYSFMNSHHTNDHKWPKQAVVKDGSTYDFIIVGGGTAGCVLAARLAEDKKTQVLLIEAGGNPSFLSEFAGLLIFMLDKNNSISTYKDSSTRCHKNNEEILFLGRELGGTSSLNYLITSQGHYTDYDDWAKLINDSTWNWEGVLPYFRKASNFQDPHISQTETNKYFGDNGPMKLSKDWLKDFDEIYFKAFIEAGEKRVQVINGKETMGYSEAMFNLGKETPESPKIRQSTAYSYIQPKKDSSNLHVLKYTTAKRILFDCDKKAIGVEVVTKDKIVMKLMASKEVIISCGVIKSPKLLMLSGIGPKRHLENKGIEVIADLPVGKNYHDHDATVLIFNVTNLPLANETKDPHEYPAHAFVGYSNTDKTSNHPTYSTINWLYSADNMISFCTWPYNFKDRICNDFFAAGNTNQMLWTVLTYLHPESRGEVRLQSSDHTDTAILKPKFLSNKQDLVHQVNAVKDFLRVLDTPSFRRAGAKLIAPKLSCCDKYEFLSTKYLYCYVKCMNNLKGSSCGTVAMGSVVDSRFKVLHTKSLRVIDASVIPKITSGDIHFVTVMMAEKAADMIKKDYNLY